jgi:hypothetical protein
MQLSPNPQPPAPNFYQAPFFSPTTEEKTTGRKEEKRRNNYQWIILVALHKNNKAFCFVKIAVEKGGRFGVRWLAS